MDAGKQHPVNPCMDGGSAWWCYHRRSNSASFLILHQNTTFPTGNFQWCITLRKLISYCCVTRIIWLQKWMVIVACHHWCIKLRHICNMAMTLFVVRAGNGNRNSSPTFLFSVWGHLRIPRVSKNTDSSCRRKSNNGKRTRKCTQPICSSGARGRNIVHSWTLTAGNIQVVAILIFTCLRYLFYTSPCYRIAFIGVF